MDTPIILSAPISFKRLEQFSTIVDTNEPDLFSSSDNNSDANDLSSSLDEDNDDDGRQARLAGPKLVGGVLG